MLGWLARRQNLILSNDLAFCIANTLTMHEVKKSDKAISKNTTSFTVFVVHPQVYFSTQRLMKII